MDHCRTGLLFLSRTVFAAILILGAISTLRSVSAVDFSSAVTVPNVTSTVSAVTVNDGNNITLTGNATTSVSVQATITDLNGCPDLTGGSTTVLLYRSGISSSTCNTMMLAGASPVDAFCYRATAVTATSSCSGTISILNTTTTFAVQYYAQATDSSSSYADQNWQATVTFTEPTGATSTADSAGGTTPDVLTLVAINVRESAINYGSLTIGANTGATNTLATVQNVGNATMTLQLAAQATLATTTGSLATSSQHYATGTFTFGGNEQALSSTAQSVSGISLQPIPAPSLFWATTPPLPRAIDSHSAVVNHGFIYTTGGF